MTASVLVEVATGKEGAVRACVDRYGNLVWALARRLSPNAAEAEDAVQEIFVDLWRSAPRFDPNIASEAAFIATIARRRLIDRRRRRGRQPATPNDLSAPEPTIAPSQELVGDAAFAARAIEQLRPEQRRALLLATCHGLTHEEIAETTGMPLGTVKAHVRRGLLRVRELLTARDAPAAEGRSR